MHNFKEYYRLIYEMQDSRRNREAVVHAYGLLDHSTPQNAEARASELIKKFTKLEPLIKPDNDYFDAPSGKRYNPKDMFSWSKLAKDEGYDKLEALQNFEAMMANLSREKDRKKETKLSEKDYDVLYKSDYATLYKPKSQAASCKLGAGTKWCTSANVNNQFDSYTAQGIVLFYAITNSQKYNTAQAVWPPQPAGGSSRTPGEDFRPEEKFAVAMYPDREAFEFFDAQDNPMDQDQWKEEFRSLELPVDLAFYKKHGPSPISIIKKRVNDAASKISGQVQRDTSEGDENWELFMEVLGAVKTLYREKDPEQIEQFKKYRSDEGKPDEVFLMDVLDRSSLEYFTDGEYNPVGSYNWGNSQFQQEIVRNITRLTYLINQSNGEDWKEEDIQDMDDLAEKVKGPFDGDEARNVFYMLRRYISRHLNDQWPELEEALIKHWEANHDAVNIKVTGGFSEQTDTPFEATYMWMRTMMEIKGGEWPELEQMIHKRIKSVLHKGDKDPNFENRKNGIQSMGVNYNSAANFYRQMDKTERRAWLPQSDGHFKRYMDGEWDMDGPPLTDQAERERQYKSMR